MAKLRRLAGCVLVRVVMSALGLSTRSNQSAAVAPASTRLSAISRMRMRKTMGSYLKTALSGGAASLLVLYAHGVAFAQEKTEPVIGKAVDGQYGFIPSGSQLSADLSWFHNAFLLPIIVVISLFVLMLLVVVAVKFNEKANPTPSRTTHNSTIEVVWTVVPILILVAIAIPSFRLLSQQVRIPEVVEVKNEAGEVVKDASGNPSQAVLLGGETDMAEALPISRVINLKATGNQWNWTFNYAEDSGGVEFTSIMLTDEQITDKAKTPRLLSVDNEVVVPVNSLVRLTVTASDVLHSFAMPSFGLKMDAVKGRANQTWFRPEKIGVYYGQCSELCGKDHAFMPAVIRVVTVEQYDKWLAMAKANAETGKGPGIAEAYMVASIEEARKLAAK
jgi:cytochrome c oxidase subunit II